MSGADSGKILPQGKLDPAFLGRLLASLGSEDPTVLVGPGIGEDAAVVDPGPDLLVVTTDPITFVTDAPIHWLVQVNVNDVAAMGARPRYLAITVLLPEGRTSEAAAERLFSQLHEVCGALDITVVGGHTEVTAAVNHPVFIGMLVGTAAHGHIHRSSDARPGDILVMSGWAGLEGSTILAQERPDEVAVVLGEDGRRRVAAWSHFPNLTMLDAALALASHEGVHAMHDATESGVAGGVRELAQASGCGCVIREAAIPVREETRQICNHFGIDWRGLISSGLLLATVAPEVVDTVTDNLRKAGLHCVVTGQMTEKGLHIEADGQRHELPFFPVDELTRIL